VNAEVLLLSETAAKVFASEVVEEEKA